MSEVGRVVDTLRQCNAESEHLGWLTYWPCIKKPFHGKRCYSTHGPFTFTFNVLKSFGKEIELLLHPALSSQRGPDDRVVSIDGENLLLLKTAVF